MSELKTDRSQALLKFDEHILKKYLGNWKTVHFLYREQRLIISSILLTEKTSFSAVSMHHFATQNNKDYNIFSIQL